MTREDLEEFYEERCAWPKEKAEALAKAEMETYRKHQEKVAAGRGEE